MFCIKCGKTLEPSMDVCPDCGTKVVLPEGFDPNKDNTIKVDIDMLVGEKTVAADHGALARKAAAAASANTATEAPSAEPVVNTAPVASVVQDSVPHSPAGFDLKSVKKTMNGRSILIDDSPLPGAVPAYIVPAPVQAVPSPMSPAQFTEPLSKPQKKKTLILIVAAAVLGVALVAVLLAFFLGGDKDKKGRDKDKEEDNGTAVTLAEVGNDDESEKSDKEDFISDKTGVNIIGDEKETDRFWDKDDDEGKENGDRNESLESPSRRPPSNRPTNPFNSEDRTEPDNDNSPVLNVPTVNNPDKPVSSDTAENIGDNDKEETNRVYGEEYEENETKPEENDFSETLPNVEND